MQASRLVALDFDQMTGKWVPFSLDDLKDETAGFTTPLEGLPAMWRDTFRKLIALSDGQLRFVGLTSMIAGLLILLLARGG